MVIPEAITHDPSEHISYGSDIRSQNSILLNFELELIPQLYLRARLEHRSIIIHQELNVKKA